MSCSNSRASDTDNEAAADCDLGAYEDSSIDWKQFDGEQIEIAAQQHPWWDTVKPMLGCFTDLSGIDVKPSVLGEDQYVSRIAVQLSSGSPTPDIYMVNQFGQASAAGWLEPLDDYLDDTNLTDEAWYGMDDFFPSAAAFGQADDQQFALPITAEVQMLFTRSDLVETPPTTLDELVDTAAAVTTDEVAGFGSRAVAAANQTPWPFGGFAWSDGGTFLSEDGTPKLDSTENIEALATYATLLSQSGPKGVAGWGFLENQQAMQRGTLAMWPDSSTFLGGLRDPETSKFADQIDAYPFPSGSSGDSVPAAWYWTIGMNSKSEHKDAAWLFMQWATSKPVSEAGAAKGASPARISAWESPKISETIGTDNAERIKAALASADSTSLSNAWKNEKWSEVSDALARAINAAVTGEDPAQALTAAQAKAVRVMG